jgi:hypothetical protein
LVLAQPLVDMHALPGLASTRPDWSPEFSYASGRRCVLFT